MSAQEGLSLSLPSGNSIPASDQEELPVWDPRTRAAIESESEMRRNVLYTTLAVCQQERQRRGRIQREKKRKRKNLEPQMVRR